MTDAESRRRRAERRVPDAAECRSPGLASVLDAGTYRHPAPAAGPVGAEGLLLLDPRMRLKPELVAELDERCSECGYGVRTARRVTAAEMAAERLAELHYLAHDEIARTGTVEPWERVRLLAVYDRPDLRERFGAEAWELPIVPAERFCTEHDVDPELVERWSRESTERRGINSGAVDGPNEIGDCKFVNVFHEPGRAGGRAFFLLNPHMREVVGAHTEDGAECLALHLEARSPHALPWRRLRRELCGATDPARAEPGSLRGDAFTGVLPLVTRDGGRVTRWNNGLHMSNGAAEAARELAIWLGVPGPLDVLVERPCIDHRGRRRVVGELTNGMGLAEVEATLAEGTLVPPQGAPVDPEAIRRTDLAWRLAKELRGDALAVLASPEVTEVLVVTADGARAAIPTLPDGAPRVEVYPVGAVAVPADAIPLWDPAGLAAYGRESSPTAAGGS